MFRKIIKFNKYVKYFINIFIIYFTFTLKRDEIVVQFFNRYSTLFTDEVAYFAQTM